MHIVSVSLNHLHPSIHLRPICPMKMRRRYLKFKPRDLIWASDSGVRTWGSTWLCVLYNSARYINLGSTDHRTNPKTIFQGIISWFITNNINNTNMGGTNETTAGSDTWLQFIQMCTWHLSTQWASRILERDDCITFRIIRNCDFLFNLWKFKIKIYNARIVFQ